LDVRARVRLEANAEITLEANPGTFEKDRFKAFRQAGVTRLSVGVQSFDDRYLKALGRVHNRAQARPRWRRRPSISRPSTST
jgi:coproporphyrinogen III oxidase-like Fe-S oxidoreductase